MESIVVLLHLLSQEVSTGNGTVVNLLSGCPWVMLRARFVDVILKHRLPITHANLQLRIWG